MIFVTSPPALFTVSATASSSGPLPAITTFSPFSDRPCLICACRPPAPVTPGKVQPGKGSDSSRAPQQRISFCQSTTPPPSAVSNSTLCAEGRAISRAPFTFRMAAMSLGIYYWGARSCLPQANFSGDEEE